MKKELTGEHTEPDKKSTFELPTIEKVERYLSETFDFRRNVVSEMIQYREVGNESIDFTELNEANVYIDLKKRGFRISQADLSALMKSDFVPSYNPIEKYFEDLPKWNTRSDHIGLFASCVETTDPVRLETQLRKCLVRCIACALEPNVVNKQIFVLVGERQNTGKSTLIRWLCPPRLKEYYTENINFHDKDSLIAQTENFMINLDELAQIQKADINRLKSIISKEDDKSRRAYGSHQRRRIRRVNYFGSTNNTDFLTDGSGSVRWLCFELVGENPIDFNYSDIDVNEIWSQAYALYKSGFKYQLNPGDIELNEKANTRFKVQSQEMETISRYFLPAGQKEEGAIFATATDILGALKGWSRIPVTRSEAIGRAMVMMGFKKSQEYVSEKGYQIKGYWIKAQGSDISNQMISSIKDE